MVHSLFVTRVTEGDSLDVDGSAPDVTLTARSGRQASGATARGERA